jgi:DnaJ family protein A protein 5
LRNSAAAQAARSRAANLEKLAEYVVPDWAQSRDGEEDNGEFSLSEEEEVVEEIECVVCNKTFKSENQFEAHEKSKKHVKAVQKLQWEMRKENANLDLERHEPSLSPSPAAGQANEHEEDDALEVAGAPSQTESVEEEKEDAQGPGSIGDADQGTPPESDTEDDEYAPRSAVEDRISNAATESRKGTTDTPDTLNSTVASLDDLTLDSEKGESRKVGKAKLKREKKAARQAAEADASNSVSLSKPLVSRCIQCQMGTPNA